MGEVAKALQRMKKEIRDYVWNFYPDEHMVKQTLNVSRPSTIFRTYPSEMRYAVVKEFHGVNPVQQGGR